MADVTLLRSVTGPARKPHKSRGSARNHAVTPRYASQTTHSFSSVDLGRNVTILLLGARCYVTASAIRHTQGLPARADKAGGTVKRIWVAGAWNHIGGHAETLSPPAFDCFPNSAADQGLKQRHPPCGGRAKRFPCLLLGPGPTENARIYNWKHGGDVCFSWGRQVHTTPVFHRYNRPEKRFRQKNAVTGAGQNHPQSQIKILQDYEEEATSWSARSWRRFFDSTPLVLAAWA